VSRGKKGTGLLPWALGAVVVAAVIGVLGRRGGAPSELAAADAQPGAPSIAAKSGSLVPPQPSASAGPSMMTPAEVRDFQVRIAHEQCEQGAARINELQGRDPHAPDPKTLNELSICLRIGNVAWFKCVLQASSGDDARDCNRRFLSLDNPPPH
jgi:hypothetical protein